MRGVKIGALTLLLHAIPGVADVRVENAWIRAAPPGVETSAGYATLTNTGNESIILRGASSPEFSTVEFHETKVVNNVTRMTRLHEIEIPPHESIIFSPGGLHFMLNGPARQLPENASVSVTLVFDDGQSSRITFTVKRDNGDRP